MRLERKQGEEERVLRIEYIPNGMEAWDGAILLYAAREGGVAISRLG